MTELRRAEQGVTDAIAAIDGLASGVDDDIAFASTSALKQLLERLPDCRERLDGDLRERVGRLEKRLHERDPVTDQPRYGEAASARVRVLVDRYNGAAAALDSVESKLREAIAKATAASSGDGDDGDDDEETAAALCEKEAEEAVVQEAERLRQEEEQKDEERRRAADATAAVVAAVAAREALAAEAAVLREQRARLAKMEAERQEAERIRLEREARELTAATPVGVAGVEDGLRRLEREVGGDVALLGATVREMLKLLHNIVANPEEPKFKTIRLLNEAFYRAMGRFEGAVHVLMSAGFRLRVEGGQKLLLMTEPDLATDADGWARWYQTLKDSEERLRVEVAGGGGGRGR